jgi:hypothetical protein
MKSRIKKASEDSLIIPWLSYFASYFPQLYYISPLLFHPYPDFVLSTLSYPLSKSQILLLFVIKTHHYSFPTIPSVTLIIHSSPLFWLSTTLFPYRSSPSFDPFEKGNIDRRLFVADIPPHYSLLLNKFNTLEEHVSTSRQIKFSF